jgi:hypothetical protein
VTGRSGAKELDEPEVDGCGMALGGVRRCDATQADVQSVTRAALFREKGGPLFSHKRLSCPFSIFASTFSANGSHHDYRQSAERD